MIVLRCQREDKKDGGAGHLTKDGKILLRLKR